MPFLISRRTLLALAASLGLLAAPLPAPAQTDPLPSWNDGAAKQAILDLVAATTTEGGADYVAPGDRIATFDQDGTPWVEQPLYGQGLFALAAAGRDGAGPPGVEGRPSRSSRC